MTGRVSAGRVRRTALWAIVALVGGLLLSGLPLAGATPAAGSSASASSHATAPVSIHHAAAAVAKGAAHPALTTNGTVGPVFSATTIASAPTANVPCYWQNYSFANYHYCYPTTQNPSLVHLGNGDMGLAYSIYTTFGPSCNSTGGTVYSSWTATSVAWSSSNTNGSTWSPASIIGASTCQWPASSEPSFAAGSGGNVYGAFVMSNKTVNATYLGGSQPLFPPDWANATGDRIGFVTSSNNGTSWSSVAPISGITSAERPQIAVTGQTIYIAYVNTENSSAVYPGAPYAPLVPAIDVQVIASTNGGSTWSSPAILPALNSSAGYWSMSPSIAINATGTVGVAYATNRSCVLYCYYLPAAYYADQIVFVTSTTNGSTWSPLQVIGNFTGESYYYQDFNDRYNYRYVEPWASTPQTSIAFGGSGQSIYVAFAGGFYKSASYPYYNYQYSGVFATYSGNAGATWTQSTIEAQYSTSNYDNIYSPAIAVSGTNAYIAYVWLNSSYCPSFPCSPFIGGYSSWLASSTNGVTWISTFTAISPMPGPYYASSGWQGWQSSVAFDSGGRPVSGTTLPGRYTFGYVGTNGTIPVYAETYFANVTIGHEYTGNTTNALFVEHNLTAGTVWGVAIDGYVSSGNGTAINVSGVPINVGVLVSVVSQTAAYRVAETSKLSIPDYYSFPGPTTVDVNYTIEYGVQFSLEPSFEPYVEVSITLGTQYYYVEAFSGNVYSYPTAQPWYFPGGVKLEFFGSGEPPVTYWNGTGPGSYTGGGADINLTLTAPVNETAWGGSYGVYNEGFHANGLPSTSVYSFHFNGANYSASANTWLNVSNVGTGGYTVSSITANSSQSGWEYFGWIPGGSNVVVVPSEPTVGFDFAFVNVSAPVGLVTFQAMGIGNGTVWSVQFNGTYYSSSVTTLTVSTRPGTFPWAVGSAVAANASVGYAPVGTGGTVTVTTGSTVNIAYTSAYRVDVIAGVGGSVSGAGNHWLASGASMTYSAVASTGYTFGGWTGTGTGSYTGSNVNATVTVGGALTETASFYPLPSDRFNVTFQQSTIPTGTPWTVYLNGVGYSSNTTTLTVSNLLSCAAGVSGQYHESVPYAYDGATGASRYAAVSPPSQFCTNGGFVQTLTFAPQYQVTVSATPGGSAYLADANVQSNQSVWAGPTDTVQLTAIPALGYAFGGWNGTGSGSYTGGSISPPISAGGPVTEFATFVPLPPVKHPTYSETFVSSVAFAAGTTWSVKVQSASYAGVGPKIVVSNLAPATYTVTVSVATASDGLTRWSPTGSPFPIHVTANGSQTVTFGKPSYWVTIGGSSGGTESPASGWYATGAPLNLNATVDAGQTFVSWAGTGTGNYTGNLSATQLTVLGPITEFATFQPLVKAATVVTSFWSSTTTWAILGLVGVLVGLIVGIAVRRFRTAPATATNEPMRPWTSGETGTTESGGGSPSGGTP